MTVRRSNTISENGAAPAGAAVLYRGSVMHHRMKPKIHRFSYSVFSVLLDLDRLSEADASSWMFSVNRFNLLSFHERDHGNRDGSSLRRHIEKCLASKGMSEPKRILLLAYPRLLGYGFNPLSVYYTYDRAGQLTALIYEVRNTFGGLHTYVLPVEQGQMSNAGIRQEVNKAFYVSPFLGMEQRYHFRIMPPGGTVRVRILEKDTDGPVLAAAFSGSQRQFTTRNLFLECVRVPLLSFKVIGAIHWEAFKIWSKRVPFQRRPAIHTMNAEADRLKS